MFHISNIRRRRNVILEYFIITIIGTIALVLFVRSLNRRASIPVTKFNRAMENLYYVVFDSTEGRSGEYVEAFSKLQNFDDYRVPKIRSEAIFANRTQVIFMIYDSEEDAVLIEKRFENAQHLKVYKETFMTGDYTISAKTTDPPSRGENYNRFYTETLTGDFVLISQIDNTLLVAYVDKLDIEDFNKTMNKLGY